MVEKLKLLLGEAANNYTDAQITLCLEAAKTEVEVYCQRELDKELELIAERIAIIKLNRLHTEGLESESYSGISQNYINGYPEDIKSILKRKRLIKFY